MKSQDGVVNDGLGFLVVVEGSGSKSEHQEIVEMGKLTGHFVAQGEEVVVTGQEGIEGV